MDINKRIIKHFKDSAELKLKVKDALAKPIAEGAQIFFDCVTNDGKILCCGNGGSAADAQHFAAEFVGKFRHDRRPYPAIALTTDTSILTAWSNDQHFDSVFGRKIEALGTKGDVLVVFSTSGNSNNIIHAIDIAHENGLHTIAFLGKDGGRAKGKAHYEIIVPSDDTPRIQEVHVLLLHIVAEEVERRLVENEQ